MNKDIWLWLLFKLLVVMVDLSMLREFTTLMMLVALMIIYTKRYVACRWTCRAGYWCRRLRVWSARCKTPLRRSQADRSLRSHRLSSRWTASDPSSRSVDTRTRVQSRPHCSLARYHSTPASSLAKECSTLNPFWMHQTNVFLQKLYVHQT